MTNREKALLAGLVLAAACSQQPGSGGGGDQSQTSTKPAEAAGPSVKAPAAFERDLALLGVTFRVQATSSGSENTLTITPAGATQNAAVTRQIDGTVRDAEVGDLNVDGLPEVYVYVVGAGSGSYGNLAAYTTSTGAALLEIYLPPIADDPVQSKGYMGHDEFELVENTFVQRFPLYNPGDANAAPTGKRRQLQYKLMAGENGWRLKLDRAVEY